MEKNCIIGYTGFVGSNIINKYGSIVFDEFYNSKNIDSINTNYNVIVFAGLPGNVGYANKNHKEDLENVNFLMNKLQNIKCNKFILISTINVYPCLHSQHTESEVLEVEKSIDYYGKHRLMFEKFISESYDDYSILRLPSIYGTNLKKGILFDLLNKHYLEDICIEDKLQFYDLSDINDHIKYVIDNNIKILNLVSEPIYVKDILDGIFTDYKLMNSSQISHNNSIINLKIRQPKNLNICSSHFTNGYIYNSSDSITKIKNFVDSNNKQLLVVIPLYKIKQHLRETNVDNHLFESYKNMYNIARDSYLKYNNNIEIRILENDNTNDELDNFGDMFKDISKKIIDIHFIEKRDILYVESDTVCFGKLTFENINKLLMFNLGTGSCDLYNKSQLMNSGVIYIPKNCNMDHHFTMNLFNTYDFNSWIYFERFWNILYYKQFTNFEESISYNIYMGKYNFFKTTHIPDDFIKSIRSKEFFINNNPGIVHAIGSRGAANCLNLMNKLTKYEITENPDIIYDTLPNL